MYRTVNSPNSLTFVILSHPSMTMSYIRWKNDTYGEVLLLDVQPGTAQWCGIFTISQEINRNHTYSFENLLPQRQNIRSSYVLLLRIYATNTLHGQEGMTSLLLYLEYAYDVFQLSSYYRLSRLWVIRRSHNSLSVVHYNTSNAMINLL